MRALISATLLASVLVSTLTAHSPRVTALIQGTALSALNRPLSRAQVRLRDVRFGRVRDIGSTDDAGIFVFHDVDPGSYVVELFGSDKMTLAASEILNVDGGAVVSTIVKLPFRVAPFGLSLGSALAITAAAAASGILATTVAGQPVSPVR